MVSVQGIEAGQAYVRIVGDTSQLETAIKKTQTSITSLQRTILAMGATFQAQYLGLFRIGNIADQLDKMSIKTGMSVETLSAFRYAAEVSGTSLGAVETAIKRFSASLQGADMESRTATLTLQMLGFSVQQLAAMPIEQRFNAVATAIARIPDPMQRAAITMRIFGRDATSILPMLENLPALTGRARALGFVITPDQTRSYAELKNTMTELRLTFEKLAITVLSAVAPVIKNLAEALHPVIVSITDLIRQNSTLFTVLIRFSLLEKTFNIFGISLIKPFKDMQNKIAQIPALIKTHIGSIKSIIGSISEQLDFTQTPHGFAFAANMKNLINDLKSLSSFKFRFFVNPEEAKGPIESVLGKIRELKNRALLAFSEIPNLRNVEPGILTEYRRTIGTLVNIFSSVEEQAEKALTKINSKTTKIVRFLISSFSTAFNFIGGLLPFIGAAVTMAGAFVSYYNTKKEEIKESLKPKEYKKFEGMEPYLTRFEQLAGKQRLSNQELQEASMIVAELERRFGKLNVMIDATTGSIINASDALEYLKGRKTFSEKEGLLIEMQKLTQEAQEIQEVLNRRKGLGFFSKQWETFITRTWNLATNDKYGWWHSKSLREELKKINEEIKLRQEQIRQIEARRGGTRPTWMADPQEILQAEERIRQAQLELIEDSIERARRAQELWFSEQIRKYQNQAVMLEKIQQEHALKMEKIARDEAKRIMQAKLHADLASLQLIQDRWEREKAIEQRNLQERLREVQDPRVRAEILREHQAKMQHIEQQREKEAQERRKRLQEQLTEQQIEVGMKGLRKEIAKINHEYERERARLIEEGATPEDLKTLEEIYRLKRKALQLTTKEELEGSLKEIAAKTELFGTFNPFAVGRMGFSHLEIIAKNTAATVKQLEKIRELQELEQQGVFE